MSTISKFAGRVVCTKAQFDALAEKDPNKEYLLTDDDTIEKPKWRNTLPHVNDTLTVDEAKVLFTKVTIMTTDSTNFPGMSGKSVTIQGFSTDGFAAGTIVCDETTGDIKYSPCFIGSITSSRASGILIKGSNAVAIVNVDSPSVTFAYEYLW
jgi:hypothetical protein